MRSIPVTSNARGILYMLAALACLTLNDSLLKLVIEDITPHLGVAVRGVFATVFCALLVVGLRVKLNPGDLWQKNVLWRNLPDLGAILFFSVGIANTSLPAVTSISLLAPILVVVSARVFLNSVIHPLQWLLILVSLCGALMVAQPGGAGFNAYALMGFGAAVMVATRDILGRLVPARIPALVVVLSGNFIVSAGAFIAVALFDGWVKISLAQLAYLAGAGVLITAAQYFIFTSFRVGDAVVVAPFFYTAAIFAMIYSVVIFGVLPNSLALVGIAVILIAGVLFTLVSNSRQIFSRRH